MLDLIVMGVIIIMAIWGWKSGLIKSIFALGNYVISAIVATLIYPYVTEYLAKTKLYDIILTKFVAPNIQTPDVTPAIKLPQFITDSVNNSVNTAVTTVADSTARAIISLISILIVFLICRFGLRFLVGVLDFIAKLPILSFANKLGGIVCGALNGFIILYVIFGVLTLFINDNILNLINSSNYAKEMYNNNLLLKFIFR